MLSFWRAIFQKLNCDLLTSTAYYTQTDGQSERANQTVEIAIRYYVSQNPESTWIVVLPYLQGYLNNSKNQSTGVSPNEVLYGFNVRDTLGMLSQLPEADLTRLRQLKRDQAEESIAFANAFAKLQYDSKHKPLSLSKGDNAYLRLNHGYEIAGVSNRKLHHQRVGPFKILDRVGPLAYRLELPPIMRIHPVVSVAQLEPSPGPDPYQRLKDQYPPPVVENDSLDHHESDVYELEAIVSKRSSRGKTQYLVKWKGYGHEYDAWYDVADLGDAPELIKEYEDKPRGRLQRSRQKVQVVIPQQASRP